MITIDMRLLRYINLLEKISGIKTKRCFIYNNQVIFAVPRKLLSKAIGPKGANIEMLSKKINKKVKIISELNGTNDIERFIGEIVSPTRFKSIEITETELIISAGNFQNKASLIGRDRKKEADLKKIVRENLNLELKII